MLFGHLPDGSAGAGATDVTEVRAVQGPGDAEEGVVTSRWFLAARRVAAPPAVPG